MSERSVRRSGGGRSTILRLVIGAVVAVASLVVYFSSQQDNPVTGETQYIDLSVEQEIALGLEAAPEMAAQFGGLSRDSDAQALVDQIGQEIVRNSAAG